MITGAPCFPLITGFSHGHLIFIDGYDRKKRKKNNGSLGMTYTLTFRVSNFFTRRVLARLLSTLLCCSFIVIKPWSRFGGPAAYLLLTLKELVFSAQETLAQHLEATILNITGAFFGIGLSTLARFFASLRPDLSASSRAIPAIFLVSITFLGV